MTTPKLAGFGTRAVHAGKDKNERSHTTPVYRSASWEIRNSEELEKCLSGKLPVYARHGGNPTVVYAEKKICSLEGGGIAFLRSSGMNAVSMSIRGALRNKKSAHGIVICPTYGRTYDLCKSLKKEGHEISMVLADSPNLVEEVYELITEKTEFVFGEITTNPTIFVWDVPKVARVIQRSAVVRPKLIVDSSFASPVNFRPLECGADVVVHSATKYLGGYGAVILGAVVISKNCIEQCPEYKENCYEWGVEDGGTPGADDAWLLGISMKTLHIRVPVQNNNAMRLAEFLEGHSAVIPGSVSYPGLKSYPQHALAQELMYGFGGMLSFRIKGGIRGAENFLFTLNNRTFVKHKPSLGYTETIVESPRLLSQQSMSDSDRKMFKIYDDLIRVSVGIEDSDDIIGAFEFALKKYKRA